MPMTATDFLNSLSPEQAAAFIALRDEINTSNQVAMGQLSATKAGEIDDLKQALQAAADNKHSAIEAITATNLDAVAAIKAESEAHLADVTAAQASAAAQLAAKDAELTQLKTSVAGAIAIIRNPETSHEEKLLALNAAVDAETLEARIAAARAEVANAQAEAAAAQARLAALAPAP